MQNWALRFLINLVNLVNLVILVIAYIQMSEVELHFRERALMTRRSLALNEK